MISMKNNLCMKKETVYYRIMIFLLFAFYSCEVHKNVPFNFPEYQPVLIIQGAASPQSGGMVSVEYNQPLRGISGVAPDLPDMKVNLRAGENFIFPFALDTVLYDAHLSDQNKQTAYFILPCESIDLEEGVAYRLEVIDLDKNTRYESSPVFLPPLPEIKELTVECPEFGNQGCDVNYIIGSVQTAVHGVALQRRPPDSLRVPLYASLNDERLFEKILWPDQNVWDEHHFNFSVSSIYQISPDFRIGLDSMQLNFAYLSKDLSLLLKEVAEHYPLGEDPFISVHPFHSNFGENPGIFGLYNEVVRKVGLK